MGAFCSCAIASETRSKLRAKTASALIDRPLIQSSGEADNPNRLSGRSLLFAPLKQGPTSSERYPAWENCSRGSRTYNKDCPRKSTHRAITTLEGWRSTASASALQRRRARTSLARVRKPREIVEPRQEPRRRRH